MLGSRLISLFQKDYTLTSLASKYMQIGRVRYFYKVIGQYPLEMRFIEVYVNLHGTAYRA